MTRAPSHRAAPLSTIGRPAKSDGSRIDAITVSHGHPAASAIARITEVLPVPGRAPQQHRHSRDDRGPKRFDGCGLIFHQLKSAVQRTSMWHAGGLWLGLTRSSTCAPSAKR